MLFSQSDVCILNLDDEYAMSMMRNSEGRMVTYSVNLDESDYTAKYIRYKNDGIEYELVTMGYVERVRVGIPGEFTVYNSMAAGLSACILDIKKEDVRRALSNFEGVEHRLEYVDTIDGVRYINDSKATNVNSCWYALESVPKNTILILGGKDKGNDYTEIEPLV